MVPVSQLELCLSHPLPPSLPSPPPSLPQVYGSSRHYYSSCVHLFVYSHYCGVMLPQEEREIQATEGSVRNQPEAFTLAEVRQTIRITAAGMVLMGT